MTISKLFFMVVLFYQLFVVIVVEIARHERLGLRKLGTFSPILLGKQLWRFGEERNHLWKWVTWMGWDRFAGRLTFDFRDCRRIRLWKLIGRLYATRAWFHISRLPIWMSSHFCDSFTSCRLMLAMTLLLVFCSLNLMPNINPS